MNDQDKWQALHSIPWQDARDERIKRIALDLWRVTVGAPDRERLFALLAHAYAGRGIRFQRDTDRVGGEDIAGITRAPSEADAIDALRRGVDDCDAKARLFIALHIAVGLRARMMPIWGTRDGAEVLEHVYPEVWLDGKWLPAETTLARAVLGEEPRAVPREANGKRLLT